MIAGILLAAGQSRRMGSLKPLLPLGNKPLIARVADVLLGSAIDKLIVVLGYHADEVARGLSGYPVHFARNPHPEAGMLSSIRSGLTRLPENTEAFVLALADQPFIESALIDHLITAFRQKYPAKSIVIPVYQGKRGHPIVVDLSLRDEIEALPIVGTGLRQVVRRDPERVLEVAVDTPDVLNDLDYPNDYAEARRRIES